MAARPRGAARRAPDLLTGAVLARERAGTAYAAAVAGSTVAAAGFLAYAVGARRPHEDEALALLVGRGSLGQVLAEVHDRGGAPLHYLLAWAVVHAGGGLGALRALSAAFAVAAIPVAAALCARLAGRRVAAVAAPLLAASWLLLFHGTFARMYSLFLLLSALSYLALLRAVERRGWPLWTVAAVATAATHTYGAIVIASQALWLVLARPLPLRRALVPFAAVAAIGVPLWRNDAVLSGRYGIGLGAGGSKLDGPLAVLRYLWEVAGDCTAGWPWAEAPLLAVAAAGAVGLARARPRSALLLGSVVVTPAVVLAAARIGSSAAPETRHLIFALPFVALALAAGLALLPYRLLAPAVALVVAAEVAWGVARTPELYRGEPSARVEARAAAARWLEATQRPDDVLLGYDPLFLGLESRTVVPRADPALALAALRAAPRLGRGVFVLDASDTGNRVESLRIPLRRPPGFEARTFGPFLVLRTEAPTGTVLGFLDRAIAAEAVGKGLDLADADVNYDTMRLARNAARQR